MSTPVVGNAPIPIPLVPQTDTSANSSLPKAGGGVSLPLGNAGNFIEGIVQCYFLDSNGVEHAIVQFAHMTLIRPSSTLTAIQEINT